MTHEEKTKMRQTIYLHLGILLEKVHRMFENDALTPAQMAMGGDILKDIAKADSSLAKACYYDTKRGDSDDRKY